MKKINNKGFLLVETLVTATFVLTVLIILFLQFKNLIINYNNSYKYNTVEGIYTLNTMKKYLNENDIIRKFTLTSEKPYQIIAKNDACNLPEDCSNQTLCDELIKAGNIKSLVYTSDARLGNLKIGNYDDIKKGMRNFIKQLSSKTATNRLIAEYENGTYASIAFDTMINSLKDLYVASYGDDTTGYGTISSPYATIGKAYKEASDSGTSTIYVMDNITPTSTTIMDKNKDIVLTSCTRENTSCPTGSANTIKRGNSLTSYMIREENGSLTLSNITIDGNNVVAQDAMVLIQSDANIEKGTTLTGANNGNDWGGAIAVNGGVLTMNNGSISNNTSNNSGGAGIFIFGDHKEGDNYPPNDNYPTNEKGVFIMNGGSISNNTARDGAAIWNNGEVVIINGNIADNTSWLYGGAINNLGTLNIEGGVFNNNKALSNNDAGLTNNDEAECGGAIGNSGTLNISGGKFTGNMAGRFGGAIVTGGKLAITGGTISSNTAKNGGGIQNYGELDITGGTISSNTAKNGGGIHCSGTCMLNNSSLNITNNNAEDHGGGVAVGPAGILTITNAIISGNSSSDSNNKNVYVFNGGICKPSSKCP